MTEDAQGRSRSRHATALRRRHRPLRVAKTWSGDLTGTGHGLMLSAGDPSWVRRLRRARDRRRLAPRRPGSSRSSSSGSCTTATSSSSTRGAGSGTGDLVGMTGSFALTIEDDGTHRYALGYVPAWLTSVGEQGQLLVDVLVGRHRGRRARP